jgi:hypothetical protein
LVSHPDSVRTSVLIEELSSASTVSLCTVGAILAEHIMRQRDTFIQRQALAMTMSSGSEVGKGKDDVTELFRQTSGGACSDKIFDGNSSSSAIDRPALYKPRRILVGRLEFPGSPDLATGGKSSGESTRFDVAIEWDRWQDPSEAGVGPSTWTKPGLRLLFTQQRKTIAYILTEVVTPPNRSAGQPSASPAVPRSPSAELDAEPKREVELEAEPPVWALRGMAVVDDAWRGKGLSRACLSVWLLICWKVQKNMQRYSQRRGFRKLVSDFHILDISLFPLLFV